MALSWELSMRKPLHDLGVMIRNHSYASKATWRRMSVQNRQLEQEAAAFAQIIARYRPLMEGKRLILFEVAGSGANSPGFETTFEAELNKIPWLNYKLLNTSLILNLNDYFFSMITLTTPVIESWPPRSLGKSESGSARIR